MLLTSLLIRLLQEYDLDNDQEKTDTDYEDGQADNQALMEEFMESSKSDQNDRDVQMHPAQNDLHINEAVRYHMVDDHK